MRSILWVVVVAMVTACAADAPDADHDEPEDFIVGPADGKADGVPATFDMNNVVDDALLTDAGSMSVDDVQAFFEKNPYGTRSWLASYEENGVSAAQMVVEASQTHEINPLVLIARMQVETSLVSKTATPTQRMINRALGCGCPDGQACNSAYAGLQRQLDCGARTLRRWYDASIDGSGEWRKGTTRSTLDPRRVTPGNHATATFYAYTPWVLVGSGGTWLAWNVTRKYQRYAESANLLNN
ncbi:MAG TPA: hypothetical protein VL326_11190 [Kofleriaceae bacterium]|nr:hypothetical protein [Kofleriaceae bacterium]